MQIVSLGDNLHEVSDLFFSENLKNIISLSSVESAHSMVSVKEASMAATDNMPCAMCSHRSIKV